MDPVAVIALSKSATSGWVDTSVTLVFFTALVVVGLVGEYAKSERRQGHGRVFEMLLIIGVAGELLAETGVFFFSRRLQVLADRELRAAIAQAGDARASANGAAAAARLARGEAERAKAAASGASLLARKASEKLARVQAQSEELEAEAKKARTDLINLAACNAPRVIGNWTIMGPGGRVKKSYVDPLKSDAGQVVYIEVVSDAEARRAALNIVEALKDARWDVIEPIPMVSWLPDGVSVDPSPLHNHWRGGQDPSLRAFEAAEKLVLFLHSYDWEARIGIPLDARGRVLRNPKVLPAGAMLVRVGLYPPAEYQAPPGDWPITAGRGAGRARIAKVEEEDQRRWQAEIRAAPPADRADLERMEKQEERSLHLAAGTPCHFHDSIGRRLPFSESAVAPGEKSRQRNTKSLQVASPSPPHGGNGGRRPPR